MQLGKTQDSYCPKLSSSFFSHKWNVSQVTVSWSAAYATGIYNLRLARHNPSRGKQIGKYLESFACEKFKFWSISAILSNLVHCSRVFFVEGQLYMLRDSIGFEVKADMRITKQICYLGRYPGDAILSTHIFFQRLRSLRETIRLQAEARCSDKKLIFNDFSKFVGTD